jgi:outer membrane receptor protein involved in Fe transport
MEFCERGFPNLYKVVCLFCGLFYYQNFTMYKIKFFLLVSGISLFFVLHAFAQKQLLGNVSGMIIEKSSGKPLEFASVIITSKNDSSKVKGTITDSKGGFVFEELSPGKYTVSYSFIGFDKVETPVFSLDSKQNKTNLGKLYLSESNQALGEVEIIGKKSTFVSSIDRKTFNVGEDLMSKTGSVSDLLQNVPSVQVDIEGNISLRGSENVMVLINGRPSALMGANRAAVLQQMPANTIEKIEVITNPSAKYKPDGTSGIINIVIKKNKGLGLNGSVSVNAGNEERYNGNVLVNYNPGKLNFFGSYSLRQDDRIRFTDDSRKRFNTARDTISYIQLNSSEHSRPLSHILNTGIDYTIDDHNKMGASGSYNYRSFTLAGTDVNTTKNNSFILSKDYDRKRTGSQNEKDLEWTTYLQHSFNKEGHELNADFTTSQSQEVEDNHYANNFRIPSTPSTYDNTLIKQGDGESQFTLEYINPISEDISFEAGYIIESRKEDMDFFGEKLNPLSNIWEKDISKSNRFVFTENIHVLYSTWEQEFEKFGFLAGLRAEQANVDANQITTDTLLKNHYFRLYPSLHLAFKITGNHELQLNYSHRIRRPEGEELNPFPEYRDPYNLQIGNPYLKPTDIHSIEMGYQYKKNNTNFLSTLYYRYNYNEFTEITKYLNDSIKVTTRENLSKSNSAGLELVLSTRIGEFATVNLGSNTFYQTIDASSLGYSNKKSAISWSANLSTGLNLTKSTVLQITSNYRAERLTPQGKQLPVFVMNTGLKQEVFKRNGAFILTVSDVFNTMQNKSIIDTPELYEKMVRKRSARMIYAGFTYNFGHQKKGKDIQIKYDNQL